MNKIEGGVIHLVKLVYFQRPLNDPGEIVNDVAICSVERRLPTGDQAEVEIFLITVGQLVYSAGIHSIADTALYQRLIELVPGQLLPAPHWGKHKDPGQKFIGGEEKPGQRIQHRRSLLGLSLLFRRRLFLRGLLPGFSPFVFLLFLSLTALVLSSDFLHTRIAGRRNLHPKPAKLRMYRLQRQRSLLIQTEAGGGQVS